MRWMHTVLVAALVGVLIPSMGVAQEKSGAKKEQGPWHWCKQARQKNRRHYVVCVDATTRQAKVKLQGGQSILKPNTPIGVAVRHSDGHSVTISVSGEVGLHVPGTRRQEGSSRGGLGFGGEEGAAAAKPKTTLRLFAPRVPKAEVTVGVVVEGEQGPFAKTSVQLIVEETFSGAVRMGIAGIFGNAVDRSYSPYLHAGSGQHEIVANESGPFDLEFVIGFAPFLESGGRGYTSGSRYHFAPYVGVGVLSMGEGNSAQWLKSIHLGLEWEPTPTFSIAFTGVLRRVTRLRKGSVVGGPTGPSDGDVPTAMSHEMGMAVVLNLSPDFFQFGTSGVAGVMNPGGSY